MRLLRVIGHRLAATPFASIIGMVGVNSAINLFVRPASSPQHELLRPFDWLAVGIYGVGGALILVGIAAAWSDVEAAGCVAFAGGALIAAVSWAALVGWSAWNQVLVLVAFAGAALTRAWHIAHGQVLVLIEIQSNGDLPRVVSNGQ